MLTEVKDRPDLKSDEPNSQRKRNSCDLGPDRKKEKIICFYFFLLLLCWGAIVSWSKGGLRKKPQIFYI